MRPPPPLPSLALNDLLEARRRWCAEPLRTRLASAHVTLRLPPGAPHAVMAGMGEALARLARWHVPAEALGSLAALADAQGHALFPPAFLDWLGEVRFTGDAWAARDGTPLRHGQPVLVVEAPAPCIDLIVASVLDGIALSTRVATAASLLREALPEGSRLVEDLHGMGLCDDEGALAVAAFVGGADGTSNVTAALRRGIPSAFGGDRGGAAWVMASPGAGDDGDGFRVADAVRHLNVAGNPDDVLDRLALEGHLQALIRSCGAVHGVRLPWRRNVRDGCRWTRRLLERHGLSMAEIIVDAREVRFEALLREAPGVEGVTWNVGRALLDEPLASLRLDTQSMPLPRERSESAPQRPQVRRVEHGRIAVADLMVDGEAPAPAPGRPISGIGDDGAARTFDPSDHEWEDLLVPVFQRGHREVEGDTPASARRRARDARNRLPGPWRRWQAEASPT